MIKRLELTLTPEQAFGEKNFRGYIARAMRIEKGDIRHFSLVQRSIDSRQKNVKVRLLADAWINEDFVESLPSTTHYPNVAGKQPIIIIGSGPAGLFAALRLISLGFRPVILERGKEVHARKYDIASLNRNQGVNPDSNYCFGEGGAGTFSDGKLYTRATKRGRVADVLRTFVEHGAQEDILIDTHPHIGSDRLPSIIENMRNTILDAGGEIHFGCRVVDFILSGNHIRAAVDQNGNQFESKAFILATGHSARDIYEMLFQKNIELEAKDFALGIRIEHPQAMIDSLQYHSSRRNPYLPAASYSMATQVEGRGVFSFCMCPGGIIVPSASSNNQLVVNGMSNSRRNSPFANSGIVVSIGRDDMQAYSQYGVMMGLRLQEHIENLSFLAGGSCQAAPAQRLVDFLDDRISVTLPECSYHPGVVSYPLGQVLPEFIVKRLKAGFHHFNGRMKGFITQDALLLASESRTSSPLRIPRDPLHLHHIRMVNLYPCGEGSGYSGGIVSSAIDGIRAAGALAGILGP